MYYKIQKKSVWLYSFREYECGAAHSLPPSSSSTLLDETRSNTKSVSNSSTAGLFSSSCSCWADFFFVIFFACWSANEFRLLCLNMPKRRCWGKLFRRPVAMSDASDIRRVRSCSTLLLSGGKSTDGRRLHGRGDWGRGGGDLVTWSSLSRGLNTERLLWWWWCWRRAGDKLFRLLRGETSCCRSSWVSFNESFLRRFVVVCFSGVGGGDGGASACSWWW